MVLEALIRYMKDTLEKEEVYLKMVEKLDKIKKATNAKF